MASMRTDYPPPAVPSNGGGSPLGPRATYRDFSAVPRDATKVDILRVVSENSEKESHDAGPAFVEGNGSSDGGAPSTNIAGTGGGGQRKRRGPSQNFMFPTKLHKILSRPDFAHIIAWTADGRAWKVLDKRLFSAVVMPEYFSQSKYPSFVRQVNGWGYRRIAAGPDKSAYYYHELFLRGRDHLVQFMDRTAVCEAAVTKKQSRGCDRLGGSLKEADPLFSAFPLLPPLDLNAPVADPGRRYGMGRRTSGSSTASGKDKGKKKSSKKHGSGSSKVPYSDALASIPDGQVSSGTDIVAATAAFSDDMQKSAFATAEASETADAKPAFVGNLQGQPSGYFYSESRPQQQQVSRHQFSEHLHQVKDQLATFQYARPAQTHAQQQHPSTATPEGGHFCSVVPIEAPSIPFVATDQEPRERPNIRHPSSTQEGDWGNSSLNHPVALGANVPSTMKHQQPAHLFVANYQSQQQQHSPWVEEEVVYYSQAVHAEPRQLQQQQHASPAVHPHLLTVHSQAPQAHTWNHYVPAPRHDEASQHQPQSPSTVPLPPHVTPSHQYNTVAHAVPMPIQLPQWRQQDRQHQNHRGQMSWPPSSSTTATNADPFDDDDVPSDSDSDSEDQQRKIYEALEQFCASGDGDHDWLLPTAGAASQGGSDGKGNNDRRDEIMADVEHCGSGGDPFGPTPLPFGVDHANCWSQNHH